MLELLPEAQARAFAPLSRFFVGAVVRGSSGSVYLGANIEIPGLPLSQTVHAEQAALANAYMAGEREVTDIAVTAAPCGHCRQFLQEMSPDGEIRVLVEGARALKLSKLLPAAFGPRDLGRKQGALPPVDNPVALISPTKDAVVLAALEAARKSYAPYTRAYSGVALLTADKHIFAGSYIENAAFNPSLPPLQTALAGLLAAGARPDAIVRAALVEFEAAKVSQLSAVRSALSVLAPTARVKGVSLF
jgi:cytidine deaminase